MLGASVRRAAVGWMTSLPFKSTTARLLGYSPRFYSTTGEDGQPTPESPEMVSQSRPYRIALQMIQYALSHARAKKSADSYADALLVLEQGAENLKSNGGQGVSGDKDGVGMMMLAMATLLHESGDIDGAMEKLRIVREVEQFALGIQDGDKGAAEGRKNTSSGRENANNTNREIQEIVGALEGMVGINLEAGQDHTSSITANECLQLLKSKQEDGESSNDVLTLRCRAIKGLVDLVCGDAKSAEFNFEGLEQYDLDGNFLLSCGEFHHSIGDLTLAKELYKRALSISEEKINSESYFLSTANMVPEEVILGATCALGQVNGHQAEYLCRDFHDAEELLTKALTTAEKYFGLNHPKVGAVLTCTASMFGQKAKLERSSSLLIQEGLYRRALDLLKAPALDSEGSTIDVARRDIIALARGGYAEILSVQQNRKGEGEKLRNWAEKAWRNRRLCLAEALEFNEPSKAAIVDTRVSRVL